MTRTTNRICNCGLQIRRPRLNRRPVVVGICSLSIINIHFGVTTGIFVPFAVVIAIKRIVIATSLHFDEYIAQSTEGMIKIHQAFSGDRPVGSRIYGNVPSIHFRAFPRNHLGNGFLAPILGGSLMLRLWNFSRIKQHVKADHLYSAEGRLVSFLLVFSLLILC